jgi:hypothetical protein
MADSPTPSDVEFLLAKDLEWDMPSPCNDCPFRRDAPDHLGVVRNVVGYLNAIEDGRFSHTCHKTDNRADAPKNWSGRPKHCAGALLFLTRAKCDLQLPLLEAGQSGKIDLKALAERAKKDDRVFSSTLELIVYYVSMGQRLLHAKGEDRSPLTGEVL